MLYKELKKQAIKDLSDYYYLKSSLVTLQKEISIMQNNPVYNSPTFGVAVMSTSSADSALTRHISRLEHLEKILQNNTEKLKTIDLALNALRKPQQEILFSYYINRQRKAVYRLAIDTHTDRSALYRRAAKALDKYILAYFGTLGEK